MRINVCFAVLMMASVLTGPPKGAALVGQTPDDTNENLQPLIVRLVGRVRTIPMQARTAAYGHLDGGHDHAKDLKRQRHGHVEPNGHD